MVCWKMETKVLEFNRQHQLFKYGDTLFLAVSGGPDSLALLHFFASIKTSWDLSLTTLTVDHQLRGQQSLDDVRFVKEESEKLGIPCLIGQVNVNEYKRDHHVGTQVAAREMRYQFFQESMKNVPNGKLVFGHHQDDLSESMLMQFIKGVRPNGIPVKRELGSQWLIRPFLCLRKDDIYQYVEKHQLKPRLDPSNEEDDYTRNRVRHHVMPSLEKENPGLSKSLFHLQKQLNEEDAFLQTLADQHYREMVKLDPEKVTFSIQEYKAIALPLQRRIFHLILNYLYTNEMMDKDYFDTFNEWLISEQQNSHYQVNENLAFVKAYDECQIRKGSKSYTGYEQPLYLDESVQLPNGWVAKATKVAQVKERGTHVFVCDAYHISFPLTIRTRKNGDRIKPKGMNGHKKVKDIFIDNKIPKYLRDEWPMVEANGEIIWIPYVCKSHLVKDSGHNLIQITFHK